MRLKKVSISAYKNLREFALVFCGSSFIEFFVGKNGSGKSNFLEALIEIFSHLYDFKSGDQGPGFNYEIEYEIDGAVTRVSWNEGALELNGKPRKLLGKTPLPEGIIVYYSGQNKTISEQVGRYYSPYKRRVKGARVSELPRVIAIGPDYKELLIAVLLMQKGESISRKLLCSRLGIENSGETATLTLRRPSFAAKTKEFDPFDDQQLFWGAKGIARTFLDDLLGCIRGDFTIGSLFNREKDQYIIPLNVELFREQFGETQIDEIFGMFDVLKVFGMLQNLSIPVRLTGNLVINTGQFSDGQFQSVYLFAISELFKDRNCLTLLDEPDAFLHPEWQSEFLNQICTISDQAARTNHILMCSHSASTIAASFDSRIQLFEADGLEVKNSERDKAEIIKSLSSGLITFSETEAELSIEQVLVNSDRPILFVEGVTDKKILELAWKRLYPEVDRRFDIEHAYDCSFLRNLLKRGDIFTGNPERKFFALFDFDEAYDDWTQLGELIEEDPRRCLTRKLQNQECFSMLLPVPENCSIRSQVISPDTGESFRSRARMSIELLFRDVPELADRFEPDPSERDGCIRFVGGKVRFAEEVLLSLDSIHFGVFEPIFNFVTTQCD